MMLNNNKPAVRRRRSKTTMKQEEDEDIMVDDANTKKVGTVRIMQASTPEAAVVESTSQPQSPQQKTKNDNVVSDDDSGDEWSSLLSNGRSETWWEEDGDSTCSSDDQELSEEILMKQWEKLERQLEQRRRHFQMIIASSCSKHNKNSNYIHQILQREEAAGIVKKRELLLSQQQQQQQQQQTLHIIEHHQNEEKESEQQQQVQKFLLQKRKTLEIDKTKKQNERSLLLRIYDILVFEYHTTIPATIAVLLQCIVMIGLFDSMNALIHALYRKLSIVILSESAIFDIVFYGIIFFCGVVLMTYTGYLYWWLNDTDYNCCKFDYHNRLRLPNQYTGAKFMAAIRQRDLLCCFIFLIGYNLTYMTSYIVYGYLEQPFDESVRLLNDLPSKTLHDATTTSWDPEFTDLPDFICERTCQEEMDRQEAIEETMRIADQYYTFRVLSSDTYMAYWNNIVHNTDYMGEESIALLSPMVDVIFSLAVAFVSILILRYVYGFVFWRQY